MIALPPLSSTPDQPKTPERVGTPEQSAAGEARFAKLLEESRAANPLSHRPGGPAPLSPQARRAKALANADPQALHRLREAAGQFEAMLVKQMLGSLEGTTKVQNGSTVAGQSTYGSMIVDSVAGSVTGGAGLGLAKQLVEDMAEHLPARGSVQASNEIPYETLRRASLPQGHQGLPSLPSATTAGVLPISLREPTNQKPNQNR